MKAVGVVVEYNPFHNGHYYHIQETKKVTNADVVVAVMSGNFLQRGEPALVTKWARTKMALEGGADLVIELPYVFATQKAEVFAYGAVALLNALQIDSICFGSENGQIDSFYETCKGIEAHKVQFDVSIQQALKEGKSYPRAAADAFRALELTKECVDLSEPNNILGFHYVQAIHTINNNIIPYTIKRTKANYHDQDFQDQHIASATSIRNYIFSENRENLEAIGSVIPETTYLHLLSYKNQYEMFHQWEHYFSFLKYRLLSTTASQLRQIYEVEEGLENRLIQNIASSVTFQDFMNRIKTKRYTWTRLQRLCLHILTNTTKEDMVKCGTTPSYIRLLGTTLIGQQYLNKIKKTIALPLVARVAAIVNEQLNIDIKAAKVFASALQEPFRSQMIKEEFATPPLRYDQNRGEFLS